MKLRYLTTLSLAAALSGSALSSFAAPPEPLENGPGGPPRFGENRPGNMPGERRSPEEREKERALAEKVNKDPAVIEARKAQRAANQEFIEASNKAILEKDPSLKDLLPPAGGRPPGPPPGAGGEHQPPAPPAGEGGEQRGPGRGPRGGGERGGWRRSPEERAKLEAARAEAAKNPEVAAAAGKRDAANKALKDTLKSAILKEDPSLEPTIDKVVERMSWGGMGMGGRGPRREGGPRGGRPPGPPPVPAGEEGAPKGPPPAVNDAEPES